MEKVDKCLDSRDFEKASSLGYSDVSSEFIFLQRTLGGLQDTVIQKQKFIGDICAELIGQMDNISYEEVAPLVEQKLQSLKPKDNPEIMSIMLGKRTVEKLNALGEIRHTPIKYLVENIVATAMRDDEVSWLELERSKPEIPNAHREKKEAYTSDEVLNYLEATKQQSRERDKNLY